MPSPHPQADGCPNKPAGFHFISIFPGACAKVHAACELEIFHITNLQREVCMLFVNLIIYGGVHVACEPDYW
jgi:hypothetical protein